MRRYSIFHPLLLSFLSKSLYQDVGRNWPGMGFSYLLLLLALVWIPEMVQFHRSLGQAIDRKAAAIISQIPSITISNGEVSTDVETPYFIKDPEKNRVAVIIDLTGEYSSLESSEADALLTKTQLWLKQNARETRMYDLSGIESFELNQEKINRWLAWGKQWLAWLFYPLAVLFAYVYRIVQALLYGLIGLLFCKGLHVNLSYAATVRLAVVAVTPVILLDTARSLLEQRVPFWPLICFLVAMGYLFFGVQANSEAHAPSPEWRGYP